MDLQLAAYKADRFKYVDSSPPQPVLKSRQPKMFVPPRSRDTNLDRIAKQLRHSTWKRQESHNKQLQHFLDRERYQQNQTWQSEYDRLASRSATGVALQPFVDARLEALKTLMLK